MEYRDLLKRRRMVRHYERKPVPREALERIAATIRHAPSAGHSQGWRALVVTDPDLLAALAEDEAKELGEGLEPWFGSAPAHVMILTREQDYHDRYRQPDKLQEGEEIHWPVPFWLVDAGAALMLVLLAAIDEGFACGIYGVQVELEPRVRELLAIPDDLRIVAGVTLGGGAPDPGWSRVTSRATRPRRETGDLVRWQRWSS